MKQFDTNHHKLPPDFSWLEMEDGIWEKVDRRKRKRRFLWVLLFALLGSSIGWSLWAMSKLPTEHQKAEVIVAHQLIENEEELCLEQYQSTEVVEENAKTSKQDTNAQKSQDQLVEKELLDIFYSQENTELVNEISIKPISPISELTTATALLASPIPSITTPKIKIESSTPWKRIALHSGINSFESNAKNQSTSEVNRNDLETSQVGMQVSLDYEWSSKKENHYWGIGMNYTRLHSRFEYLSEREITITRDLYLSPWELLLPREYLEQVYRQVQLKAIEKRRVIHHNSQNLIDLSLYKGVQKKWKTLDLHANFGGQFNLVHWANGKIADASGAVILLEDMKYYKWNIGASLLLEGGFRYPINAQLDFSGQLGVQQSLNSWIRKEQLVRQQPRVYWLNVGLSYGLE